jgi:hypothetical protein
MDQSNYVAKVLAFAVANCQPHQTVTKCCWAETHFAELNRHILTFLHPIIIIMWRRRRRRIVYPNKFSGQY